MKEHNLLPYLQMNIIGLQDYIKLNYEFKYLQVI